MPVWVETGKTFRLLSEEIETHQVFAVDCFIFSLAYA
jgi:hypothetical protein